MLRKGNESLWSNESGNEIVLLAGMQVIWSWKSLIMLLFNLGMGLARFKHYYTDEWLLMIEKKAKIFGFQVS